MTDARFNDISFRRFLDEDRLMGCRCRACGAHYVPPKPLCSCCHCNDLEWIDVEGRGTLAAFTCIRVVPPTMQTWGYGRERPYCSGVVELSGGGRVVALIDEVDPTHPETIGVGMPLIVKYLHQGEGESRKTLLSFKPA